MQCYKCGKPAVGQCQMCGKFYCSDHGDVACNDCKPEFERAVEERRFGPFSRYIIPIAYFIVCGIGGGMLGLVPVIAVRGISSQHAAYLLPICPPAGFVAGLVLAVVLRGRIKHRSGLRGIIGATLLATLFSCLGCDVVQIISNIQKMNEALEFERRADEMGLAPHQLPPATSSPSRVGAVLCLGAYGVIFVIIAIAAVRMLLPKSSKSMPEIAENEGEGEEITLVDPD